MDIKNILSQLTLQEKASLCVGSSLYQTASIPRLNIPSIRTSDGPSGINKGAIHTDHTLPKESSKVGILFPSSSCTCCSFDCDLMQYMGENFGDEMVKEGIAIIFGPGVNIKRSPLCGRNFEYFSEDPLLSTEISGSFIKGVQSKGVGCCMKHFAANNREFLRHFSSSDMDERTLREIYLASFEGAVKKSCPWAVMSSYNQINNVFSAENYELLTTILRDQWDFKGIVISDWYSVQDRVESIKAGLDLEMPGVNNRDVEAVEEITEAVQKGDLDEKIVDKTVERILNIIFKVKKLTEESESDPSIMFGKKMVNIDGYLENQHQVATKIAENSIVLLKNEDSILPLPLSCDHSFVILYVGEFANKPHVKGFGSAYVKAFRKTRPLESSQMILEQANSKNVKISYARGFGTKKGFLIDSKSDILEKAKSANVVVVFAGTFRLQEIENRDRKDMSLPADENELISDILEVNKNVVVVLQNGSPVEMPWANDVKAILETYFAGEGCGEATARILFGLVNPSGHLAESFPVHLEDNPSYESFKMQMNIPYDEGVFVGYRYYDSKNVDVLFPFGHGLSYTSFEYKNARLDKEDNVLVFNNDENYTVLVDVVNTGNVVGKTVAQLYVSDLVQEVQRPLKELKGFNKIELNPDEMKTVSFSLNKRSFSWWDERIHDWKVSAGNYRIIIGQSSKDKNALVLDLQIQ